MDIRQGKYSYEELFGIVEAYEIKFKEAALSTTLPEHPNEQEAEKLLISLYEDYYGNMGIDKGKGEAIS